MSTEKYEKLLMKIAKKVLSGVLRLGRGAATVMGLAMLLALVLGVGTTALAAASGDPLKLGRTNTIDKISKLVGDTSAAMLRIDNNSTGPGATALDLQVEPGKPPMEVNSSTEVQGMNVDEVDGKSASEFLGYGETAFDARAVDGKSADEIGVNGLERVDDASDSNSSSPKRTTAECPAGKVVVGTGYDIFNGKSGSNPNEETNVVVDSLTPLDTSVFAVAHEEEPFSGDWSVVVFAICATAP
jgi:hypothetical protein